jgi:hypothetical protein
MKKAMFSVSAPSETGSVQSYCANHLQVFDGPDGQQMLGFISSGRQYVVPVDKVEKIELKNGWYHCNECDQPVGSIGYENNPPDPMTGGSNEG